MADWWEKPFSVEVDGQPWAVLTDKVWLIGIQGPNKLAPLKLPDVEQSVIRMLQIKEKNPESTSVERLREFLGTDEYAEVLGVPFNTGLLLRVILKVKTKEIEIWDATSSFFAYKCLGFSVKPKWKAFLMGVRNLDVEDAPLPVYEFEEKVTLANLFEDLNSV